MLRPLYAVLWARLALALFVAVQLNPLGLSWCQTGDMTMHVGCCCGYCLHPVDNADAGKLAESHCTSEQCPACGHALAATVAGANPAGPRLLAQCCEHTQMQYAPQSASFKTPARAVAELPATAIFSAASQPNVSHPLQVRPRWHAPPWASPPTCGSALLPLRI
jgi:hypothetical protein